jgi:hypothetical protein
LKYNGLRIYDTTDNTPYIWTGATWSYDIDRVSITLDNTSSSIHYIPFVGATSGVNYVKTSDNSGASTGGGLRYGPRFSQVLLADGSNTRPTLSFSSSTNLGIYRVDSTTLGFASGGAKRFEISSTSATSSVPFNVSAVSGLGSPAFRVSSTPVGGSGGYQTGVMSIGYISSASNFEFFPFNNSSSFAIANLSPVSSGGGSNTVAGTRLTFVNYANYSTYNVRNVHYFGTETNNGFISIGGSSPDQFQFHMSDRTSVLGGGGLAISRNLLVSGSASVSNNLSVGNNLLVSGSASVSNNLLVSGTASINNVILSLGSPASPSLRFSSFGIDTGLFYENPYSGPPLIICPDPNTPILLSNFENVRAGDLKVGDLVYTIHETTGVWGDYKVSHVEIVGNQDKILINFSDDSSISVSKSHKFLMTDNEWRIASNLSIGETIRGLDSNKTITLVTSIGFGDVVKIEVEDAHTYISSGVISHNKVTIPTNYPGVLGFSVAGNQIMKIDGNGNVGILPGDITPILDNPSAMFSSVNPRLEVLVGNSISNYQELMVLRGLKGSATNDLTRVGVIMKLSDDDDINESNKMGGMILESTTQYSNSPSLYLVTANQKRLGIDNSGNIYATNSTASAALSSVSGNKVVISLNDIYADIHNKGTDGIGDSGNNATPWSYPSIASGQLTLIAGDVTSPSTNCSSFTVKPCAWHRTGNTVTVSGQISFTISSSGVDSTFKLKIPIPSSFGVDSGGGNGNNWQLNGLGKIVGGAGTNSGNIATIQAYGTSTAEFKFYPSMTGAVTMVYHYTYTIGTWLNTSGGGGLGLL